MLPGKPKKFSMPESPLKSKSKDVELAIDELADDDSLEEQAMAPESEGAEPELNPLAEIETDDLVAELEARGWEVEKPASEMPDADSEASEEIV